MEHKSITERIVEHLRSHIIIGSLKPGQKLNEIEISSCLGVSRPPLREAFRILEHENLIASIARKGSYVTEISLNDCMEVFEVREMLECQAVDILKTKRIKLMAAVTSAMKKARSLSIPETIDPYIRFQYIKDIASFHIRLVEAAGNSWTTHFYHTIFSSMARYQAIYIFENLYMKDSPEIHEQIMALIGSGNYTDAKKILREHIRGFVKIIQKTDTLH